VRADLKVQQTSHGNVNTAWAESNSYQFSAWCRTTGWK